MKKPVFAVEGLRFERDAVILEDITWRVERGQHWVILGANGSGKTSLLRALTGYLAPTRGEVRIGSATFGAADWREVRDAVGLVSAGVAQQIEPDQSARDIVLSGLDAQINFWRTASRREVEQAHGILRDIHAGHLAERPWLYLSQGERQRVLIGRALMSRRKILFLDEPCAGLDPVAREDFLGFLERLSRKKSAPTLVLVTHHVEEIIPAFTHVLLLSQGRVLGAGSRDEMLTSARLGETFGAPVQLHRRGARYSLQIAERRRAGIL
jgi:iron complex transport system ATP-binding protein